MSDLNDQLRRDGARWREEVDRRHPLDPEALLDEIVTSGPIAPTPIDALRNRLTGRAPLLISVAAVTVAALAVGGLILTSSSPDPHHTPPALASTGTSAVVSSSPSAPAKSATSPHKHTSSSTRRAGGGAAPVTSSTKKKHKKKHKNSAGASTSNAAGAPACEGADLVVSISSPSSAGDHMTLTVSVANNGATSCTISGFPAVQFTGDTSASASPTSDAPAQLTLAGGTSATAEVDWDGASSTGSCTSYGTALVSAPGGSSAQFSLDPPAQVCDASTFVTHPLTAG
jgi:hypothetical protein